MTFPRIRTGRLRTGILISVTVMGAVAGCGSSGTAVHRSATTRYDAAAIRFAANAPAKAGANASSIGGCPMFPADNIWNADISGLPVSPLSSTYVNSIGATGSLHPDFGAGDLDGETFGMPLTYVNADQPTVNVSFDFDSESDHVGYPIPPDVKIETGDGHILLVNKGTCKLYELYDARKNGSSWSAGSGAVFDLNSNRLRPDGWTSADAAGLPVTAGLVRHDEVQSGFIGHALRITVPRSQDDYLWPARHSAGSNDSSLPPMGLRLRLKANVDISGYPHDDQVILQALKTYGAFVADNGSAWYVSGTNEDGWDNDVLNALKNIKGSSFEAVDDSSLMVDEDSGQTNVPGTTPTPTPTPTPSPVCGTATGTAPYDQPFTDSSTFQMTVDATPAVANADTGVGLGTNPPMNEGTNPFATAATIRFNSANGHIEARSNLSYPATNITWAAGRKYRFRFQVNTAGHTYNAYVTAPGGQEQAIGTNLAFRNNYNSATVLNNLRGAADPDGRIQVCTINGPI